MSETPRKVAAYTKSEKYLVEFEGELRPGAVAVTPDGRLRIALPGDLIIGRAVFPAGEPIVTLGDQSSLDDPSYHLKP